MAESVVTETASPDKQPDPTGQAQKTIQTKGNVVIFAMDGSDIAINALKLVSLSIHPSIDPFIHPFRHQIHPSIHPSVAHHPFISYELYYLHEREIYRPITIIVTKAAVTLLKMALQYYLQKSVTCYLIGLFKFIMTSRNNTLKGSLSYICALLKKSV